MDKQQLNYIANTIKAKRKSLGYTQESFSEFIGISYSSYVKIENSLQKPSLDTLIKIALNLHLSLDSLLFEYNEETKNKNKEKNNSILALINSCDTRNIEILLDILDKILAIKKSN